MSSTPPAPPCSTPARAAGARVWVVSEYGHCDVDRPVLINRLLRKAGLLAVRPGPFGEVLETFPGRAFAVCDHQLAHVYVKDLGDRPIVADFLASQSGIARVLTGEERAAFGLDHPRSGELIALSEPDAWFAYPYWLDDRLAPDFARTVDIHRKPGYDPCELFLDPTLALAESAGDLPAVAENARVPHPLRRDPARPGAGPGEPWSPRRRCPTIDPS